MSRQKPTMLQRTAGVAVIVVLLPIILPLAVVVVLLAAVHRVLLDLLIWTLWLPRGKDVLYITSESTIWRDYMANTILPLLADRAVVLNYSERNSWPKWLISAHVFRTLGGRREFSPMVIVFRPFRPARKFRFWQPFKDFKRGNTEPLERMTDDLRSSL